jgi:hypothetical protein
MVTTGTGKLDTFTRFFDESKSLDTLRQGLRQVRQEIPEPYSDFFVVCILIGLRASECVACIRLIEHSEHFKIYYNKSSQCLEHFGYPKIFLRRTKAAYISLVK